ncbi:MAG: B12-binding domain-containing radical SAM protein [Chloroflexi bacterium]|nr:B12-binding domain-containing radical SAM protein [Chloroflexota bacterium]
MTSILLIYPYFSPTHDRSIFRFPPLGISYIAAALHNAGYPVSILDCTFLDRDAALETAMSAGANIIGIYSMITMQQDAERFAQHLRGHCDLLVAGGPLPSCNPDSFLKHFDIVVRGEGEQTMLDIISAYEGKRELKSVPGIAYRENRQDPLGKATDTVFTPPRPMRTDLDSVAFPLRRLLPNQQYIRSGQSRFGRSVTSVITTRGCPFHCEFCSNAVFGVSYRQRSPKNVVDEVEEVLSLGYDYIHFADDVFTLKRDRLSGIIEEIKSRKLRFKWECLSRVDSLDLETARAMRDAGCERMFFGIESANESVLKLMGKKITLANAQKAVDIASQAGIRTGAFFIVGYPGETDDTVLETVRFASSLPLDYLSFTMPYPLPGTALFERVKDRLTKEWHPRDNLFSEHELTFQSDFSESKLKLAIMKGEAQFKMRKHLGSFAPLAIRPFQIFTDAAFRMMR